LYVVRRRVVRELGTILGVVAILAAVALVNGYMRRGSLKDQMEKVHKATEGKRQSEGIDLLSWDVLRETTGSRRSGPSFDKALVAKRGTEVNLIGFMVPMYNFRGMTEFLVLPVPIECYFCEAPPMRDVMLVQMAEGDQVDLVKEPVLVSGTLTLNEGAGTKFFYVIKNAKRGAAEKGGKFTRKTVRPESIGHASQMKESEEGKKDELIEGYEPPKGEAPEKAPLSP
jgi:hypothetical protein